MANDHQPAGKTATGILLAFVILLCGVVLELSGWVLGGGTGEVVKEAGFVVIGTVLATYVYEYVLRRQHDDHLLRLIEQSLIRGAQDAGLYCIHRRLQFEHLFSKLEPGDELLWLDTYCPDQPNYQTHLRAAIMRGAHVKMLAVKPDCAVALMRAREINPDHGYSDDRFKSEAENNLEHLRKALEFVPSEYRSHVTVRLYEDLPCIPAYIHIRKGHVYAGFSSFFFREPSFSEPHFEWRPASGGTLYAIYDYFCAKWDANAGNEVDLSVQPKAVVEALPKRTLEPER